MLMIPLRKFRSTNRLIAHKTRFCYFQQKIQLDVDIHFEKHHNTLEELELIDVERKK